MNNNFNLTTPQGLASQIYNDLKQKIEQFEFKPGDRISETTLSTIYDVSRTPIKNSLSRLENEGLIEVRPQRGTYVAKIDTDHISEFFMIRMLLEVSILDEVLALDDNKFIEQLNDNVNAQKKLLIEAKTNDNIDVARVFWKLDNAFHKLIFKSVNKAYIWEFILSQSSQFNRYRLLTATKDLDYLEAKVNEHQNIARYISRDLQIDPKVLYNAHLLDTLDETIKNLKKQYPDYFL